MAISTRPAVHGATWARMLAKAHAEGIQIRQLGSGLWIATSGTDPDAAYEVNLRDCECPGHAYHAYCKHRAALAAKLGHLSVVAEPALRPAPTRRSTGPGPTDMVTSKVDDVTRHPLGRDRLEDRNRIAA